MRVLVILIMLLSPAFAANPAEQLDDPALEARAREISKDVRCLVCQNQSIDESDAALAKDLRLLVRERLVAGDSDDAVFTYLTDRYGAFVLLRPPVTAATITLWIAPFVMAAIALMAGFFYVRARRSTGVAHDTLTAEEEAALATILEARDKA